MRERKSAHWLVALLRETHRGSGLLAEALLVGRAETGGPVAELPGEGWAAHRFNESSNPKE